MDRSLTEGKVSSLLIRFSLPFLLSSVIQMAYSSVDMIILGRLASPASLAGAGNGASGIMTIMSMFMGLASGGMILLGQYYGAKQNANCAKALGNIIILQAVVVVLVTAISLMAGKLYISMVNVPIEPDKLGLSADAEAWNYMRICVLGLAFQAGYNMVSSLLRSLGNSKMPLIFVSISCAINIVLDYIFVGPLKMGARGAALATIIAQAFSFAISLAYVCGKKLPFHFSMKDIKPNYSVLKTVFKLGIPISLQTVLNLISFIVIAALINKMGLYASAANGIVNNIVNIYMIIPSSIGSALSVISAQNLGAGKAERALEGAKLGILISLIIAIPATIFASLNPTPIVSIIAVDPDVIKASAEFLIPFSWDCLFVSFVFTINGFFNGCGITKFVAIHETVAAFAVRIPLTWALSLVPGATLFHIGIGTPAATLASLIMCLIYYKAKLSGDKLKLLRIAGNTEENQTTTAQSAP